MPTRAIALAALLAVPAFALAAHAAPQFQDIPAGHWAKRAASVLADRGILPGRTPVDFAGEAPLTRYELARALSELYAQSGPPSTFLVLSDMPPGHVATLEVQRVLGYGLMTTRKPGLFEGHAAVSRKEAVEALDLLLTKNGISAPARRARPIFFTDVDPRTPLGATLDRVVNRYQIFESKHATPFRPYDAITRYGTLAMLVKAMAFLNPTIASELNAKTPDEPLPTSSPRPGASPARETPRPSAAPVTPAPGASLRPSETPAVFPEVPLLRTHAEAEGEFVLGFSETLPTETGLTAPDERKEYGAAIAGGGVAGAYWQGLWGGLARARAYYLPLNVSRGTQTVAEDVLDAFFQGAALYKVAGAADFEAAIGAGGLLRSTYNMTGQLVNTTYLTADKLYLGAGPALAVGARLAPDLVFRASLVAYPAILQSYTLSGSPKSLTRWGADAEARAEYALTPGLYLTGSGHMFLSGAFTGGLQSLVGVSAGVGGRL